MKSMSNGKNVIFLKTLSSSQMITGALGMVKTFPSMFSRDKNMPTFYFAHSAAKICSHGYKQETEIQFV